MQNNVLQSALEQWEVVDRLMGIAKKALTPEQTERVEAPLKESAGKSLELLPMELEDLSEESLEPEIKQMLDLRNKLKQIAGA